MIVTLRIDLRLVAPVLALATTLFLSGPAATQAVAPAETASGSEVQRFCSNIADAARDRRYALQAKELQNLQADIDKRIAALEIKRKEYETWMKRRDEFLSRAQENIVQIYGRMKPDAAAERLAEIRSELSAAILMKLDPRKAGTILNEMDSKVAATLTTIMISAARKDNPT